MKRWLVDLALSRPKLIFGLTLLMTLLLGVQMVRIQVDTDPENMLSALQPDRVMHQEIKKRFDLSDMIVLGMVVKEGRAQTVYSNEILTLIDALSTRIMAIDGVVSQDLMSLSRVDNITQSSPGEIRFSWMLENLPATSDTNSSVENAVTRLPLLNNTLVSADGKAAAIYIPIVEKSQSYRIAQEVRQLLPSHDMLDFHITGLPVAEDTFGVEMFIQMAISAPLAALTVYLLMLYFFRNPALVASPMVMAMAVVISTMGLLIGSGHTVHIMSSMIPIFLMPVAVVDSVHILSEFSDRFRSGDDVKAKVREVMGHLFTPMWYTSITSSIGFASLALTPIPPVQVFGLFVAFGILLAFLLTVTFIPAWIVSMSPEKLSALASARQMTAQQEQSHQTVLSRMLRALGHLSIDHGKWILAVAFAVMVVSYYGIRQIQINDNPVRWFEAQHEIRVADRVLNEHFAGTYEVFMVLTKTPENAAMTVERAVERVFNSRKNSDDFDHRSYWNALKSEVASNATLEQWLQFLDDQSFSVEEKYQAFLSDVIQQISMALSGQRYFQQPEALAYLDSLQSFVNQSGEVGKSNSLVDLTKTVYRELRSGEATDYRLPETQNAVAQTLLSFQGSHRPYDLWHMVTPDYTSTAIWLQMKSGDNQTMAGLLDKVAQWQKTHPLPEGVVLNWGGLTYINVIWQGEMVSGMLYSLLGSFLTVFVVMVVLFRSVVFGVLAMIPLSITIAGIYGLIGWMGKDYDMPIAVLSSLTLGLSVDFAIHFLQRLRELKQSLGSWHAALEEMFAEPAQAITRNALVIALGFTPLLLAPLIPYKTVGVFLALIMLLSCLVTLLILPAIIRLKADPSA